MRGFQRFIIAALAAILYQIPTTAFSRDRN
jgi:hypothetical protein